MTRSDRYARKNAKLQRQLQALADERDYLRSRLGNHDRQIKPLVNQALKLSEAVRQHPIQLQAARFAAWNEGFEAGSQWGGNPSSASGVLSDPPSNPYEEAVEGDSRQPAESARLQMARIDELRMLRERVAEHEFDSGQTTRDQVLGMIDDQIIENGGDVDSET